eukprot:scaffold19313_cov75-Skeletonema_dohrnii-CCMP3373.AAC.4
MDNYSIAWSDISTLAPWEKTQDDGYGKQCSGFCGTGQTMSRWDPNASGSCPDCGRFESAISSRKASATSTIGWSIARTPICDYGFHGV